MMRAVASQSARSRATVIGVYESLLRAIVRRTNLQYGFVCECKSRRISFLTLGGSLVERLRLNG